MALRWPDIARQSGEGVARAAASVGTQTTKKRKRDAESLERARREQGADESDENFDPEDDSDLGLGIDGDESIGLDTSTGFDEPLEDFDLPEGDEAERWSTDSDEASDLPDADADLSSGDEYGWIGDDEPADDDESFDAGIDDDEYESRDDGGAEGVEDDTELDDLNLSELPALDADSDDDSVGGPAEVFDELGGLVLADEPTLEIGGGEVWKVLPARSVRVTRLALPSAAVPRMVTHRTSLFAWSDALYRLEPGEGAFARVPLSAAGLQSFALTEHDGVLHAAAVAAGRVYVSRDAAQHFEPLEVAGVAEAYYTRSGTGVRLWWRTTRGTLGSDQSSGSALPSELDGEIRAFHADGRRSVAVLTRQRGRVQLLFSSDAGKRFARHPVPALAAEPQVALSICKSAVLLRTQTDARCAWLPEAFAPVASLARAPAALSEEDDETFVYACVPRGEEWLIVRRAARAARSAPLVIASFDKQLLHEPLQLAVGYAEGEALCVYVAGEGALLRIEASIDGEKLT